MVSSIQFIVDDEGEKTGVIIPLEEYETLLEDLDDLKVALERKDEEEIPFEVMKKEILEDE